MWRKLLIITVVANLIYIIWLAFNVTWPLGAIFYFAEVAVSSLSFLFLINHWNQKHSYHTRKKAEGSVDIFICTVDEPAYIIAPVIKSATMIDYPDKKIFILDDGKRKDVKKLAQKYGVHYFTRQGRKDYKAGNLNSALRNTCGDYILVLDADQKVIDRNIINELLGHFKYDENLGMLATRQNFNVPQFDFNHDTLFYEHMQTGKNSNNAAISSGSGVIYSRKALRKIGDFQTWNVVEDLYTAYALHSAGYKTLYINRGYTIGTAPRDLANIYKQRGTWALDTLRLFFKQSPLLNRNLNWRQKLHYVELSLAYLVSGIAIPVLFAMPILSLFFNLALISNPEFYVSFRLPSLFLILWLYYKLSGNTFRTSQFWAALFPAYFKAAILAILPGKPKYKVTSKVGTGKRDIWLVLPHLILVFAGLASIVFYRLTYGVDLFMTVNLLWILLMIFWFYPFIYKGFIKE